MRVEAKVATVIPPHDIAVNVGSSSGVKMGDKVVVYFPVTINDPESQEQLGVVEYTRGHYRVSLVGKGFAVASITDRAPSGNVFSAIQYAAAGIGAPEFKRVVERVGGSPTADSVAASSVVVGVGDLAYVTRDEEEEEEEEEDDEAGTGAAAEADRAETQADTAPTS